MILIVYMNSYYSIRISSNIQNILYLYEYSLEFFKLLNLPIESRSLEFWNLIQFCDSSDILLDFGFGGFKSGLLFFYMYIKITFEIWE